MLAINTAVSVKCKWVGAFTHWQQTSHHRRDGLEIPASRSHKPSLWQLEQRLAWKSNTGKAHLICSSSWQHSSAGAAQLLQNISRASSPLATRAATGWHLSWAARTFLWVVLRYSDSIQLYLHPAHTYRSPSHKRSSLGLGHWAGSIPRMRSCLKAAKPAFLCPGVAKGLKLLPILCSLLPTPEMEASAKCWIAPELWSAHWAEREQLQGQAEQPASILAFSLIGVRQIQLREKAL